jgi:hypothetical protein
MTFTISPLSLRQHPLAGDTVLRGGKAMTMLFVRRSPEHYVKLLSLTRYCKLANNQLLH